MSNLVVTDEQVEFDATGAGSVTFQPRSGFLWIVTHIGVQSVSVLQTLCIVTKNGLFVCGSQSGNLDSADGAPVPLRDNDELKVSWTGGTPFSTATATLIYQLASL